MLNNKGQSLVLFIIVLPVLLLMLLLVIDIGKLMVLKQELSNINEIVLDYGLSNLDKENIEEELLDLIYLNKGDIDKVDVLLKDDKIYINMFENSDGVFSSLIDISVFKIDISYVGYIENGEKRIERVGD